MQAETTEAAVTSIDPGTQIGIVDLAVADLTRSIDFYTRVLGFTLIERGTGTAQLGVEATTLLRLIEEPGVKPKPRSATGLYHFAILVPSRMDLARSLDRMVQEERIIPGVGDHLVSEALYLSDPDGNGIEIYRDRPRKEWTWKDGQVQMASLPIDLRAMLDELEHDEKPGAGLQPGTRIGHIHLQVADVEQADRFYHGILGFDVIARMPDALFISAGGYHHHIGMNSWESRGGPRPPAGSAGLRLYTIVLPTAAALAEVQSRLSAHEIATTADEAGVLVRDPWDNAILLTTPE